MSLDMFPRYFVAIFDQDKNLLDYRLYYTSLQMKRGYNKVTKPRGYGYHNFDYSPKFIDSSINPIFTMNWIPEKSFHSVSENELRNISGPSLPYEVLKEASRLERNYLMNLGDARWKYFKNRFLKFW